MLRSAVVSSLVLLSLLPAFAGVGESAVITLAFPFGARSTGMGEVGTALADDEAALYYNPAGLGVRNELWRRGSASHSFEYLLPAFKLTELWHTTLSGYYQTPGDFGGFGIYYNHINMGQNPITDELGREKRWVHSWEAVQSVGWGFSLKEFGDSTRYAGLAVKYFISALAPGLGDNGTGSAQGFAVDLGYLRVFENGLRIGLCFTNMGSSVYYIDPEQRDPIPFTLNTAVAFKRRIVTHGVEPVRFAGELRLDKELVINHFDGKPAPFYKALVVAPFDEPFGEELQSINYHVGGEFWIFNIGCLRTGFLFDYLGERYESTYGLGLNLFNHIRGDYSFIYAPEGYKKEFLRQFDPEKEGATGARDGQWRLTVTYTGFGKWSETDRHWWMVGKN